MPEIGRTFKLSDKPGDFGLQCNEDGLTLAGVSLLRKNCACLEARPGSEVREILRQAYGTNICDESTERGIDVVARALNDNDLGKAMAAAVLLRLPDLDWDGAARIAHAEEALTKYRPDQIRDWRGRWTDEDNGPDSGVRPLTLPLDADPGQDHPLSLPKDWVHLAPGPHRNDELADLAEWIVNAKPEDEAVLRQEINRYFFDPSNSDIPAGNEFHRALSDALDPGVGPVDRKELLAELDPITRTDPPTPWQIAAAALAVGGLFLGPAAEEGAAVVEGTFGTGAEAAGEGTEIPAAISGGGEVTAEVGAVDSAGDTVEAAVASDEIEIDTGALEERSSAWKLGWAARGREAEIKVGTNLPPNFPVIDNNSLEGIVTSIKSIDLEAPVYQNAARLLWRVNNYVDRVVEFKGAEWAGETIAEGGISGRSLNVVVPSGSGTAGQITALKSAIFRAKELGVKLVITPF